MSDPKKDLIEPISTRCTSKNTYTRRAEDGSPRPHSTYTHLCRLPGEHRDGHWCICGHTWGNKEQK